MTKKQIQELVLDSYSNNSINPEKVDKISEQMDRRELKEYIKALKNYENKNSVIITLPSLPKEEDTKKFSSLFPNKKIVYNIDPSLMLGVRIKNRDLITEVNLKDTLEDMLKHVSNL